MHVVLLGEPLFSEMLETPQLDTLRRQAARRHTLGVLAPEEVASYVEKRLRAAREASGDASSLFTDGAIDAVATVARGVPGAVNSVCGRALQLAFEQNRTRVDRKEVLAAARALGFDIPVPDAPRSRPPLVAAAAALFVLGAVAIWWSVSRVSRPEPGAAPPGAPTAANEQAQPPVQSGVAGGPAGPLSPQTPAAPANRQSNGPIGVPEVTGQPYDVLASSFRSLARAETMARDAAALGLPARIRSSAEWHQVVVGPYATRDEAAKARETLKKLSIPNAEIVSALPPAQGREASFRTAPPDEVIRRATTLAQTPDVKGLLSLRQQVETRPAADGAADNERAAMLKQIDTLLENARRRQLDLDSQFYQAGPPSAPR
jgi:hypothetical protein